MQTKTHDMSRGVFLATCLATGAAAFAATQLALTISLPQTTVLSSVQLPEMSVSGSEIDSISSTRKWPAIFGVPVVAETPKSIAAPVFSTTYSLKGLVAGRDGGFAILSDDASELMVRQGDVLDDGSVVARIDRHGVILDLNGKMIPVNFAESTPPETGAAPQGDLQQVADSSSQFSSEIQLDISKLNSSDFRQMLGRAGAVTQVVLPDGTQALDILWTRRGQLYENLGLDAGDRVLTVNGIAAGDNEAVLQSFNTLISSDTYRLEIIRNGKRREIVVTLVENG